MSRACSLGYLFLVLSVLLSVVTTTSAQSNHASDRPINQSRPQDDRLTDLARSFAEPKTSEQPEESSGRQEMGDRDSEIPNPQSAIRDTKSDRSPLRSSIRDNADDHAAITTSGQAGFSWVINTVAALGVVIGLILLLRYAWSKMTGQVAVSRRNPAIEVLSRSTVAPRSHVLLLRVGDRILVVGDSAAGLRTLADIDNPEEIASLLTTVSTGKPNSISRSFANALDRFGSDYPEEGQTGELGADQDEPQVDRARNELSRLLSRVRHVGKRKKGVLG